MPELEENLLSQGATEAEVEAEVKAEAVTNSDTEALERPQTEQAVQTKDAMAMAGAKEDEDLPSRQSIEALLSTASHCEHKAKFHFPDLFKTGGKFECEHCTAAIEYTKPYFIVQKILYYIMLAVLIWMAMSLRSIERSDAIRNMLIMFSVILAFLVLTYVLSRVGKFQVDQRHYAKLLEKAVDSEDKSPDKTEEEMERAKEQAELVALYKHYERLRAEEEGVTYVDHEEQADASSAQEEVASCHHELKPSWKNYVPGMMEFSCQHCDKRLTFSLQVKKILNAVYLFMSLGLFYPMWNMDKVSFVQFLLIALGVMILATVMQVVVLKKVKLVQK